MKKLSIIVFISGLIGFTKAADNCWSLASGYPCCQKTCEAATSDGLWGVENGQWCGIDKDACTQLKASCWSLPEYKCCSGNTVRYTDDKGNEWGIENSQWCGIKKQKCECPAVPQCEPSQQTQQTQSAQSSKPVQYGAPSTPQQFFLDAEDANQLSDADKPAVEVYLPSADKATGCAVVLCAGGAMRALSWDSDVKTMASFLNAHGIAAIGLRYHLNKSGGGGQMPPMVDVTHPDNFKQADANPLHDEQGDAVIEKAAKDGRLALRLIRQHAAEWNIDTKKVGYLGFSAGGGVALSASITAEDPSERPDFIATNFGPSLMPVTVPESAPPLLIMSRVEHPNVAAGLVALFMEWKKAGANAEIHLYGDGSGPYELLQETGKDTTETWSRQFLYWLKAKGFIPKNVEY